MGWLAARPWQRVDLPEAIKAVPTVISLEERALLTCLREIIWSGEGAIIDGGCFLGGSTMAFTEGLLDRPKCQSGTWSIHMTSSWWMRDHSPVTVRFSAGSSQAILREPYSALYLGTDCVRQDSRRRRSADALGWRAGRDSLHRYRHGLVNQRPRHTRVEIVPVMRAYLAA
jgi:hypothetical protein